MENIETKINFLFCSYFTFTDFLRKVEIYVFFQSKQYEVGSPPQPGAGRALTARYLSSAFLRRAETDKQIGGNVLNNQTRPWKKVAFLENGRNLGPVRP